MASEWEIPYVFEREEWRCAVEAAEDGGSATSTDRAQVILLGKTTADGHRRTTMSDELRDVAARAVVYQIIEQAAKARKDEARAQLSALEPGDTLAAKWDGQLLGKATMTSGKTKLVVTDEGALLAWLQYNHPTEIVISPNPAYMAGLKHVGGVAIDKDGEVVPGVEVQTGDPYVSVRKEKDAPFVVAQLLSGGRIQLDGIKELEA